ncbi:MAG: LysR family transcriptional regulator, partial [Actinoallomurus sp.]
VVTESAVSAAVTALGKDVGVPLVEPHGRGVRLTASGETFAGYARTILGLHDEAVAAARGDVDPEHGRVRVAAVTTAAEQVLPGVLASFRDRFPHADVQLSVGPSRQVWSSLERHEADLAVAGRPPQWLSGVLTRAVRANELVVVAAPGVADSFDPGTVTWLLREEGSGTRTTCEALLSRLDAEPPLLTLGSNGAVVAGAVAGLGATLVSRAAVARLLDEGRLARVPVPGTPQRRPWHAVTQRHPPPTTLLLVDHLLALPGGDRWRRPAK